MVRAGFERHVSGGAAGLVAACTQGIDFGVIVAGALMPAFTDDPAIFRDDAAHDGIGARRVPASRSQLQRSRHVRTVR